MAYDHVTSVKIGQNWHSLIIHVNNNVVMQNPLNLHDKGSFYVNCYAYCKQIITVL
jgi:hypothetical protein